MNLLKNLTPVLPIAKKAEKEKCKVAGELFVSLFSELKPAALQKAI